MEDIYQVSPQAGMTDDDTGLTPAAIDLGPLGNAAIGTKIRLVPDEDDNKGRDLRVFRARVVSLERKRNSDDEN